jgi:outer membrane protein OmpA-like peptidoglycan-associated protein
MNPDYSVAEASPEATAPAAEPATEPVAAGGQPAAEQAPAPAADVAEAAPVAAAAVEETPAAEAVPSEMTHGDTAYFSAAEKADAEQAWAAPATVFTDVPEDAPPAAVEETAAPAPAAEVEHGVTAYFGTAESSDVAQAWAAPAAMNPDYSAEEATTLAASADVPESVAPAPAVESGATAYYGAAETPDATQPWAAPATVFAEATAPASPAANACHDALTEALRTGKLNFTTSSWDILPDSYATLDRIARLAKGCEGVAIEVGGHTDNTGSPGGNKTLSELRAKAVVRYLTGAGVETSKLSAVGYGQDKPLASNDTVDGRRENRRIEFSVK